jgi:site-specific DNA recombinase
LPELTEDEVRTALVEFEPLWNELFPAEQSRIIRLLVERVAADGIEVNLRIDGIGTLVNELAAKSS